MREYCSDFHYVDKFQSRRAHLTDVYAGAWCHASIPLKALRGGYKRERGEEFEGCCRLVNEACADKGLGLHIDDFAEALHEQLGTGSTDLFRTMGGVFGNAQASAFTHYLFVDVSVAAQEEPAVEDVAGREPFAHGAELVGKHVRECHDADVCSGQVANLVMIVVAPIGNLNFQHPFAPPVVEDEQAAIELDGCIVDSTKALQYGLDGCKYLLFPVGIKEVEVEVGGEAWQAMEEHECRTPLESQQGSQGLVTKDETQNLGHVVSVLIDVHSGRLRKDGVCTLGETLGLVVWQQLHDEFAAEGPQVVEMAVAGTQIEHVEEGSFGCGDGDVVLLNDAFHPGPQPVVNLPERIGMAVYLHGAREIADRGQGLIVLKHDSGFLKHILSGYVGGAEEAAGHLLGVVPRFCVNATTRVQERLLAHQPVHQGGERGTFHAAHHRQRLGGKHRARTREDVEYNLLL